MARSLDLARHPLHAQQRHRQAESNQPQRHAEHREDRVQARHRCEGFAFGDFNRHAKAHVVEPAPCAHHRLATIVDVGREQFPLADDARLRGCGDRRQRLPDQLRQALASGVLAIGQPQRQDRAFTGPQRTAFLQLGAKPAFAEHPPRKIERVDLARVAGAHGLEQFAEAPRRRLADVHHGDHAATGIGDRCGDPHLGLAVGIGHANAIDRGLRRMEAHCASQHWLERRPLRRRQTAPALGDTARRQHAALWIDQMGSTCRLRLAQLVDQREPTPARLASTGCHRVRFAALGGGQQLARGRGHPRVGGPALHIEPLLADPRIDHRGLAGNQRPEVLRGQLLERALHTAVDPQRRRSERNQREHDLDRPSLTQLGKTAVPGIGRNRAHARVRPACARRPRQASA